MVSKSFVVFDFFSFLSDSLFHVETCKGVGPIQLFLLLSEKEREIDKERKRDREKERQIVRWREKKGDRERDS